MTETPQDLSENRSPDSNFPVAVIGSSAGGLQPSMELLRNLSSDIGIAIIVIQHLSPDQPSLLSEILNRETPMPVVEATQGIEIQPNHVYVIPPNQFMEIANDRLQLSERQPGRFMPIDRFCFSLAENYGHRAIGIILSGLDADGALGLRAIKEKGGLTFAQARDSAQYSDMPNSAIEAGIVDFIWPPAEIAQRLGEIAQHPYLRGEDDNIPATSKPAPESSEQEVTPDRENDWRAIYVRLRASTGVDFSQYKRATFERRLRRRMALFRITNLADYLDRLNRDPNEVRALYRDVLITVTHFFRDPEVFDHLQTYIFPEIIARKDAESPIRVWVAGCATGEECYSLAIALLECLDNYPINPKILIFGTDISDEAINIARHGIYGETQMANVTPEQRRRFFIRKEGRYQVSQAVRDLCVFARQNLVSDPPFSNIDFISCRNVLIYFSGNLQQRVMAIFHYSLVGDGFLCLGSSESVGENSNLFTLIDRRHRLYGRVDARNELNFDFVNSDSVAISLATAADPGLMTNTANTLNLQRQADQIVLEQYAPAGMLINDLLQILQFRGNTGPYLQPAPGEPTFNLMRMIRPELAVEVRRAIEMTKADGAVAYTDRLQTETPPDGFRVKVMPIRNPLSAENHYLLLFETENRSSPPELAVSDIDAEAGEISVAPEEVLRQARELAVLRQELLDIRAYLRATVEEKESVNQRLTTANEEILSSNEELQSTNEELQTAKEEIQATNEELKTTNDELQNRNLEARRTNDDLVNLLNNVNIPIVMLSRDLRIRRFTLTARRLFNLIPGDVGRPLSDLRLDFEVTDLETTIRDVLETLETREQEVQDSGGRWYQLRIRPYRTAEEVIDGVVLALVDIDDIKNSLRQLEIARRYAESIAETVQEPFAVLTTSWRVKTVNRAFRETFHLTSPEVENQLFFDLNGGQWDVPELRQAAETAIAQNEPLKNLEIEIEFLDIGRKELLLNSREIEEFFDERLVLLSIEDIAERKQAERQRAQFLQEQAARLEAEAASRQKDEFLSILSHELRTPLSAISGWIRVLRQESPLTPQLLEQAIDTIDRSAQRQTRLISDLLDVTRIVQGQVTLQLGSVNLTQLVEQVIDSFQLKLEDKTLTLSSNLALSPQNLRLDGDRIYQVISNVLANAVKFTPEGGRIRVNLTYGETDAEIEISDTGRGIDPEFLPVMFDRFRQADQATTRTYSGLGLGLSIVKYLVEAHEGQILAHSDGIGQGATFIIRLPIIPAEDTSDRPVAPAALTSETPPVAGARVLVIEDDGDNLELLLHVVGMWGMTAIAATTVDEAITLITESELPDVIVSDISLPERDGFDFIRWLRSQPPERGGTLPAIAPDRTRRPRRCPHHSRSGLSALSRQARRPYPPAPGNRGTDRNRPVGSVLKAGPSPRTVKHWEA